MKVLVTGSSGLIGSEAVEYYDRAGHQVVGVDNNMRAKFFGAQGDALWNLKRREVSWVYVDQNRIEDHICYISDLRKVKSHFPIWSITRSLPNISEEMVAAESDRLAARV